MPLDGVYALERNSNFFYKDTKRIMRGENLNDMG